MLKDYLIWYGIPCFIFFCLVCWIGVIALQRTETQRIECITRGGEPVYIKDDGYKCFKPGTLVK